MRTWVLGRQAEADLEAQLNYLIEQRAIDAAERLAARIKTFLRDYPFTPPLASFSTIAVFGRLGYPAPGWWFGIVSRKRNCRSRAFGTWLKIAAARRDEQCPLRLGYLLPRLTRPAKRTASSAALNSALAL